MRPPVAAAAPASSFRDGFGGGAARPDGSGNSAHHDGVRPPCPADRGPLAGGRVRFVGAPLPSLHTALRCTVPGPPPVGPPPAFPQFAWESWPQHARPVNSMRCACCRPSGPRGALRGSFQASNLVAVALDADAVRTGVPRPCVPPPLPPAGCPGAVSASEGDAGAPCGLGPWSASRPVGLGPMECPRPLGHFPFQPVGNVGVLARGRVRAEAKAGLSRVATMVSGAGRAGIARALLRVQAWQLIWHLARLYRLCRPGSSKFLLEQRLLPLPCH